MHFWDVRKTSCILVCLVFKAIVAGWYGFDPVERHIGSSVKLSRA